MFGFAKKRSYLGVDFGSAGLKAVELAVEKGKPRLVTYGFTELPIDVVRNVSVEARDLAVNSLKALVQQARVTTTKAVAALPNFAVFTQIMDLPVMSDKDLAAAVRWEAKKIVPWPLEEMILDWKKLNIPAAPKDATSGSATMKVLLIAALKNVVARYMEIFKLANIELLSLETEAFSVARALAVTDVPTMLIVDIGAFTTDLAVVERNIPLINRTLDIGGNTLTKAIAHSLNINEQRAEQFKRDFGLAVEAGGSIPKTIEAAFSPVINEVKYLFDLYQGQSRTPIQKVVLTGGSAYLPHLPDFLQTLLKVPVILGDPWERVVYPVELKPALDEVGPMLVVAIGLALREIVS
jgi:type IV pilus assembly protein PilM